MENTMMGYIGYRIQGLLGPYCNIPKSIFHLLKGDYKLRQKERSVRCRFQQNERDQSVLSEVLSCLHRYIHTYIHTDIHTYIDSWLPVARSFSLTLWEAWRLR